MFEKYTESCAENQTRRVVRAYNKLKSEGKKRIYPSDIQLLAGVNKKYIERVLPLLCKYTDKETEDEIKKIFEEKDYAKFTKSIQNASPATKDSIVELAVKMRITDNAFVSLIDKYIGINVVEAIATQAQAEEK